MLQRYNIEQLGKDGRWFILGSDSVSGWAQYYMRKYQRDFPRDAFRVTERPSGKLICLHDPISDRA